MTSDGINNGHRNDKKSNFNIMNQSISKVFPVFQKKHTQQMDKQVCLAEKRFDWLKH